MKHLFIILLTAVLIGCGGESFDKIIKIGTQGNQMKYDVSEIYAKAGSKIKIEFINNADMETMKHNIVILKDKKFVKEVGELSAKEDDYLVENHEGILAYTTMIGPKESTELVLQVPTKKGKYPFICTYPGHYSVMKGILVVN
jgi:azurin